MHTVSRYFLIGICYTGSSLIAASFSAGNNSTSLDGFGAGPLPTGAGLYQVNLGDNTLNFDVGDVNLTNQVRAVNADGTFTYVNHTITINGMNHNLNGGGTTRGFFVGGFNSSSSGSVTINDLTFNQTVAIGGSGDDTISAAGGGMGAGGGLYVGENTVVFLNNCKFINCGAIGGAGGSTASSQAGGGGMHGSGNGNFIGGGGGFGGNGGFDPTTGGAGGGASSFSIGDASGTTPGSDFNGGTVAGPGVGGATSGGVGGFGGGGGAGAGGVGGDGGFGGGGGSSDGGIVGGHGGFGGGGGTGAFVGGHGGFGGGGGFGDIVGSGGFGGGNGTNDGIGGAGAGFGGAIFIHSGGQLTIQNSAVFSGNSAVAGAGNPNTSAAAGFGALGQDIFMMSSSLLKFALTSPLALSNPIQGDQGAGLGSTTQNGLTQQGPALVSLTGANTYTGTTTIQGGELQINGSVTSDVVVQSGGTLSGICSILPNTPATTLGNLNNAGIVSPGAGDIGTITIAKNYTQTSSGMLVIDITPSANVNDQLFLTSGTATLDGTLQVVASAGNYLAGTQYLVINAPTNGTTFSNLVITGPGAANLQLGISYSSVILTVLANSLFNGQIITPGIASAVANAITNAVIVSGSDFANVVNVLQTLSNNQLNSALITLSPVLFGSLEWINARNNNFVADLLAQHVFELCCSPRDCNGCNSNASFWINAFGNFMNNHKHYDNLSPFVANAGGALTGMDYCFCSNFFLGGSVGYTFTDLEWKGDLGRGHINSYYGALYGSYQSTHFSLDISALGGGSDHDLKRKIEFSTIERTAKSDFWGYFFTGHLGTQVNWNCGCGTFEPYALVDYDYFRRNHFKEKGAESIDLSVQSKTQNMLRGESGLKAYYTRSNERFCFAPYVGLSWVGEFPLHSSRQKASFKGQKPVMNVKSYDSSVQLASPQAGLKWTTWNGFSFTLGYKGLFNHKTSINEAEARLDWVF